MTIQKKQITVAFEGSGREVQIELYPETKVRNLFDVLEIKKDEYEMLAPDGKRLLGHEEKLFEMVEPGEQLGISPRMDAGNEVAHE